VQSTRQPAWAGPDYCRTNYSRTAAVAERQ